MTATPSQPYSPLVPRAHRQAFKDTLTLLALPLVVALALPAAFAGGGTRRWFGGRSESQRAEAQAAKDAAAAAFYELDTAQRDLRISIETITAVDDSPAARRVVSDFDALGRRIDEASHRYIEAVDAHDLDRDDLEASVAAHARTELTKAKDELANVKRELDRFGDSLGPLLGKAETQLARLAPAVERARQGLLAASNALDAVRGSGLTANDLAARLATLAPELTKLNQGRVSTACRRRWSGRSAWRARPRRSGWRPSGCRRRPPRSTTGSSRCAPARRRSPPGPARSSRC